MKSTAYKNPFLAALHVQNNARPPVWFMRQAGRYHRHYQALRAKHEFIELCKNPALASEVTRGPIEDFGFDAAILFSDLLFPLEAMGMGLRYEPGPKLDWHLRGRDDLARLKGGESAAKFMDFQAEALRKIREWLPEEKGLIGFVGGPFTLYMYAVGGSHEAAENQDSGAPDPAGFLAGFEDGRFHGFIEKMTDLLAANMALQADAGADAIAIFDTSAGELSPHLYAQTAAPALRGVIERFQRMEKSAGRKTPIIYYSRATTREHWAAITDLPIACMGIDWRHDLALELTKKPRARALQGNIDPEWLFLPPALLERQLRQVFEAVRALPEEARKGWICGLGHGVLPKTPEENVRLFLKIQREIFS